MSLKTSLVKFAIKLTPDIIVEWVANLILKGIAEISDFIFDIDSRTVYVQLTLYGEEQPIEIWLDGFAIVSDKESHRFILQQAKSNRPWMNNILSRIVGKEFKIPSLPQYQSQIELVAELLKVENPDQEDSGPK